MPRAPSPACAAAGAPAAQCSVGDPATTRRFGFAARDALTAPGIPPKYVLALPFGPVAAAGERSRFHPAFGLA